MLLKWNRDDHRHTHAHTFFDPEEAVLSSSGMMSLGLAGLRREFEDIMLLF